MRGSRRWGLSTALALLRVVAAIVPRRGRHEWRREWDAELRVWHAYRRGRAGSAWRLEMALIHRSLGTLPDAARLRIRSPLEWFLWQDLRLAARTMRREPGFSLVAVMTLALGIGASTALFSVVKAVLLQPLPFADPGRLVVLWENNQRDGIPRDDVSPANYLDLVDRQQSFSDLEALNPWSMDYTGGDQPEVFFTTLVTGRFFEVMGVPPLLGRTLVAEDFEEGGRRVLVLGHGLWMRRFGGDPDIVGETISLDDDPYVVVGVMPREFRTRLFDRPRDDGWAPFVLTETLRQQRRATYLKVIGRLKPGVGLDQARADADRIAAALAAELPQTNAGVGVTLVPYGEQVVGRVRPALMMLTGAVLLLLLIACANVAGLLLSRAGEREREFAIRAATGADRGRLVRQLLTESVVLGCAGGAVGMAVAHGLLGIIVASGPEGVPRITDATTDASALLFAVCAAVGTAVLFGTAPAVQLSRPPLSRCLKDAGPGASASATRQRLRHGMVVGQVALASVLLVGAGLLFRSFVRLLEIDPGFQAERVVALQQFIWDRYTQPAMRRQYVDRLLERLARLPEVEAIGATTALPFLESSAYNSAPFAVRGAPPSPPGEEPTAFVTVVAGDYFRALGVRLLSGRGFDVRDGVDGARAVAIVNDTMARQLWPGADPVGQQIEVVGGQGGALEVVGVVSDARNVTLDSGPRPELFRPHARIPSGSVIFVIRVRGDAAAALPTLQAAIWEIDRDQPFYAAATMPQLLDGTLADRRFSMLLLVAFAGLAVTLALVGIYGLTSYTTTRRTREIGVRVALGASGRDIRGLVVGGAARLAAAGTAFGLIGAVVLSRYFEGFLYDVRPLDAVTYAGVAALMGGFSVATCFMVARRAARVDPVGALRQE